MKRRTNNGQSHTAERSRQLARVGASRRKKPAQARDTSRPATAHRANQRHVFVADQHEWRLLRRARKVEMGCELFISRLYR